MMRKIVILLACLGIAFQQMSCTSKDSQADSEVAADVDSADLEKLEGGGGEIADEESLGGDQLPEEALGETTEIAQADEAPVNEPLPPDPFAPSDTATVTQSTPPPPEASKEMAQVENPEVVQSKPKVEEPVDASSSSAAMEPLTSTTYVDSEPSAPVVKKPSAPLQKIATEPWKVGKTWFNAVYFARPGDSLASISQMIYGADKTKELKKGNPLFSSRDVRPGDKVYYSSPNRPSDSTSLLTYYEDNGMAPEVYVAKPGDNIRKIAKNLLGYDGAWKEVWASNSVESKGALTEGTELRFWKGGAMAAVSTPKQPVPPMQPDMAAAPAIPSPEVPAPPMNEPMPPPSQAQVDIPPPSQAQADIPPPPPMQEPMADIPPPPPPDMPAAEQMPPPPPVQAMNPPPSEGEPLEEGMEGESGQDMTMALGVVGLAAAGLAVLIVMRKKRKQKELDMQAMENTHVGT